MRKVIWLLAILMTFGISIHFYNDQIAIADCLDKAGNYNYQTDFCSFKETYQGTKSFISNHLPLFLIWFVSALMAVSSLVLGIVKTPVEYEESLKKKVKGIDLGNQEKPNKKLLMIDNYDSFTYNLIQYFGEIGIELQDIVTLELVVKRNDEVSLDQIKKIDPDYIVISPGPCTPNQSGISLELIKQYAGIKPILGVCLGHQAMAQVYGGEVIKAEQVMHGKTSNIFHTGKGIFKDIPNPFKATRYHSLIVKEESLPKEFEVTAWTQDETGKLEYIMGIRHKEVAMEGVQFHPESVLSEHGHQLLKNFLS